MVTDMRLTTNKIYRLIKKKSDVIADIACADEKRNSSISYEVINSNKEVRNNPSHNV